VAWLAVGLATVLVAAVILLLGITTYENWSAILIAPVLVLISLPVLSREARREGDQLLFRLLVTGLLLKLAGAMVRHFVAFDVYGGAADAAVYHKAGVAIAHNVHEGIFNTGLPDLSGLNFIKFLAGLIYTVIGPTQLGGFLVFSWLGFWGLFLFYRAFVIAVPEGDRHRYAVLIFFLPSLLFWPSSIGKEAWMMLALGIAAFGGARILTGRTWNGLMWAGAGLWLSGIVRPHIAGIAGLALAAGFLFRPARRELAQLAGPAKAVGLIAVLIVSFLLVRRTDAFLNESQIPTEHGVAAILTEVSERTTQGGSGFEPSVLQSPSHAPQAILTVVFRPLIFDANSPQTLAAGIEGTFLLILTILRLGSILEALKSMRRQPYIALAIAFAGLFVIAFSAIGNFGILARERVQLLPFYLILLSMPPKERESAKPRFLYGRV
jgi:hypothetical protein